MFSLSPEGAIQLQAADWVRSAPQAWKSFLNSEENNKMESEICMYSKFGFCKYRNNCSRHHFEEECENLSSCKNVKTCDKRHPKVCRKFNSVKGCTSTNCAYNHIESNKSLTTDLIKIMENKLLEMSTRINNQEKELIEIKSMSNNKITTDTLTRKEVQQESKLNALYCNVITYEQPREENGWFYCDICDYKCKKEVT